MSRLSLKNPLLTPSQILQSPSQERGMTRELESDMRAYGCHLIESSGIVLRVPQVVMASAQIMFQRFYYLASFTEFSLRSTVLGALFLACKVEENPQTVRNIINVVDIIIKRDRGYPEIVTDGYDSEYYDLKNEMIIGEMQVLRMLGFNVQVELPYGLLVNYMQSLDLSSHPRVPQLAWNYLNDLLRTPIYVCFQPDTIACGAIYMAAYECNLQLPMSPPWWIIFDANGEDVVQVAKAIKALYQRSLPRVMPLTVDELKIYIQGTLEHHVADIRKRRHERHDEMSQPQTDVEIASAKSLPKEVAKSTYSSRKRTTPPRSRSRSRYAKRYRSRSGSRSRSRSRSRRSRSRRRRSPSSSRYGSRDYSRDGHRSRGRRRAREYDNDNDDGYRSRHRNERHGRGYDTQRRHY